MPCVLRIALLGFTAFEREAFETFFRHAVGVGPAHELVDDLDKADCAVADAEDRPAVELLSATGLLPRSVLLGSTPRPGAALQLPRPINLALILRGLDTIAGSRETGPSDLMRLPQGAGSPAPAPAPASAYRPAPAPAPPPKSEPPPAHRRDRDGISPSQRVLDDLAYRTVTLPGGADLRSVARAPTPTPEPSAGPTAALPLEHVLVVSTDHGDYRQIVVTLQGFGFQMHLAQDAPAALLALEQRRHRYVFIDPRTPSTDALVLCRVAREAGTGEGEQDPAVVLIVHPLMDADILRRVLPAADATLRSPLTRADLLRLVGDREVARYSFADTARTITRL